MKPTGAISPGVGFSRCRSGLSKPWKYQFFVIMLVRLIPEAAHLARSTSRVCAGVEFDTVDGNGARDRIASLVRECRVAILHLGQRLARKQSTLGIARAIVRKNSHKSNFLSGRVKCRVRLCSVEGSFLGAGKMSSGGCAEVVIYVDVALRSLTEGSTV